MSAINAPWRCKMLLPRVHPLASLLLRLAFVVEISAITTPNGRTLSTIQPLDSLDTNAARGKLPPRTRTPQRPVPFPLPINPPQHNSALNKSATPAPPPP